MCLGVYTAALEVHCGMSVVEKFVGRCWLTEYEVIADVGYDDL
jgi:hypothetical protein